MTKQKNSFEFSLDAIIMAQENNMPSAEEVVLKLTDTLPEEPVDYDKYKSFDIASVKAKEYLNRSPEVRRKRLTHQQKISIFVLYTNMIHLLNKEKVYIHLPLNVKDALPKKVLTAIINSEEITKHLKD